MGGDVLYCESKLASGIEYKDGRYREISFELERFTVKFNSDFSRLSGLERGDRACSKPYVDFPEIVCNMNVGLPSI